MFSSTVTSTFGRFPFQSRQKKTELLGPYGEYFKGFNSRSSISLGLRSSPPPPDFGISDLWETAESEKEKKSEDQEFTYQNPIIESPEVETPEPLQLPPQQLLQQSPQPPNLDPMAYAPITKLDNFTEKAIAANGWNDARAIQAIPYFLKDTANSWYQSLVNKPQDFNVFKVEFLRYFSNNNSINHLVNTFTTMKQGETETVTTYLGHFHRNLRQIQTIDDDYFTAPQILNQFIRGLCSNTVTHARDFESAESEANYAQAVNLVINGLSELDSKLEKFSESINKRLEGYLANNYTIYQPLQ
ncbi:hypothetical protein G9A89_002550 [Geosiphon pyriformis]|nr:hypothetical protein G9A89_002550 [Geosiphon pyriformis]